MTIYTFGHCATWSVIGGMAFNINNLDEGECRILAEAASWARQSITFAMCLRDADTKRRLGEDPEFAKLALIEAQRLTDDLCAKATEECPCDGTLPMVLIVYTRKVFEWCDKHMNRSNRSK